MGILSNNTKVGSKNNDLILQTSGKVYVNVKERFYPLIFHEEQNNTSEENKNNEKNNSSILFYNDLNEAVKDKYPGDNKLIITLSGQFYKTGNQNYLQIPIEALSVNTLTKTLFINTPSNIPPLNVTSAALVKNLNTEYLGNIHYDRYLTLNSKDVTISGQWNFNNLTVNTIKDSLGSTFFDFTNGILTVNRINVNTLKVKNIIENTDEESSISLIPLYNLINTRTYLSSGLKIYKSEEYDKSSTIWKDSTDTNHIWNENTKVGGFSIIELIVNAYNNGFLDYNNPIEYYINLLITSSKGSPITSDDFNKSDNHIKYQEYTYTPNNRSVFETVPYNITSNCALGIYDGWFNIDTMYDEDFLGSTYECTLDSFIKAGTKVYNQFTDGKVEGIIVGCSDRTARITVKGKDCEFLYIDFDYNETEYQTCINSLVESSLPIVNNINLLLENNNVDNIIGNLSGVTNSVYGELSGYGFSSEGNVYLVNSNIANSAIKDSTLTNCTLVDTNIENFNFVIPGESESTPNLKLDQSGFLFGPRRMVTGIYNTPWLQYQVGNGVNHVYVGTDTYYFDSTGNMRMGTIQLSADGSMTIGSGDTIIHITANGTITIPSKCIV